MTKRTISKKRASEDLKNPPAGFLQRMSKVLTSSKGKKQLKTLQNIVYGMANVKHHYVLEPRGHPKGTIDLQYKKEKLKNLNTLVYNTNLSNAAFTISTTFMTEDPKKGPTSRRVLALITTHANSIDIVSFVASGVMGEDEFTQFMMGSSKMTFSTSNDTDDTPKVTEIFSLVHHDVDSVQSYIINLAAISLHALVDMLNTPAEYVQSTSIYDDEEFALPEPTPSKMGDKEEIFVRKLIPNKRSMAVDPDTNYGTKRMEHTRSGHWRRLRSGRKVWVRAHIAGNPELGSTVGIKRTTEVVTDNRSV